MRPPKIIKPYVLSFCRQISEQEPTFVPLRPLVGKPPDECFTIIPEHIVAYGGKQHIGWSIWEWPKVFIEAEFHCIWESPEGNFIDLTPKRFTGGQILFLPDPKKQYKGIQVDNIRKSLSRNKDIDRLLLLHRQKHLLLNEGDLANQKVVPFDERIPKIEQEMAYLEFKLIRKYGVH
jgi:hypothetical protein